MPEKIFALNVAPGIEKDGTLFSSTAWVDGTWVRFQRRLPRKIGGYQEIASTNSIVRGIYVVPDSPNFIVFYGTQSNLYALSVDPDWNVLAPAVDVTPAVFPSNVNYDWTFDTITAAGTNVSTLIAHAAPNLSSISNTIATPIFYGPLVDGQPLVPNGTSVSGGIVVFNPYLFAYGNSGRVIWFEPNSLTQVDAEVFISSEKIVAGLPTRGGSLSPAGLLWSLTSLIRVTFTGNTNDLFNFDTVSSQSSILTSRGIIEYDNIYFWCGVDRFLLYNGTVQELPNDKNTNFFFDNLNYAQRQKVWATKVTRFHEIWWHFPYGNATECNAAVIYNVQDRCWSSTFYDVDKVNGRSDGYFDQTFSLPIWSGTVPDNEGNYPLYVHETGTDIIYLDGTVASIACEIMSPGLSLVANAPNSSRPETDANLYITRIEPDFLMTGDMTINIWGHEYAQSTRTLLGTANFNSTTTKMDFTAMGREIYVEFICNGIGCDFQMGQVLICAKMGDVRA